MMRKNDKVNHKHPGRHSEYGQSWMLAAALLDRPRNVEELVDYFRLMGRRFGIFFLLTENDRTMMRSHLEQSMESLIKRGWITRELDSYHLTTLGKDEAKRMLADMERGGRFLDKATQPEMVSKVTLIIHFILATVKLPAAFISGSVGLLNDALDTLMDGVSSLFVYFGVKRKKERLASYILLSFMAITGIYTLWEAVCRIFHPEPLTADWTAFIAVGLSAGLCALLIFYQRYVGLKHSCVPLIAQSIDSRNHIIVAIGVGAGLVAAYFHFPLLDQIVGVSVAVLILKGAVELLIDLVRSGGEEELDLSKYGFARLDSGRRRQMIRWFLYEIDKGRVSTKDELLGEIAAAVDFSSIVPFAALGFDKGKDVENQLQTALEEVFDRPLAVEIPQPTGGSVLKLTEEGSQELKRALSDNWRFRVGFGENRRKSPIWNLISTVLGSCLSIAQVAIFYIGLRWIIGFLPSLDLWGANALFWQTFMVNPFPIISLGSFSLSGAQLLCLLCGTVLFCVGKAIMRPARRLLHPVVRHGGDNPAYLVKEGPFAKRRHPIYTGMILICVGMSIALHSVYPLLWAAFTIPLRALIAAYEERKLSTLFGNEYAEYRTKVRRRFFPWWLWLLIAVTFAAAWMGLAPLPV